MINILYLEDNIFDIDLTRLEITESFPEHSIKIARTIQEANSLINESPEFDVAILDLNLPDGNGIDILMEIRRHQFPIAVIILTGSGNEEEAIAALKAGADDYLTKSEGYLKKLPGIILSAIGNFKTNLEKSLKTLKVLYVEWNKPDIEFTERHLQKYAPHIQLKNVPSATLALELLPETVEQSCPFDILLMDYRLPGLNAIETIKIIRQERKLSIPIVLVTGHGNEAIAVQALKLGANEYLVKRENYLFRLPSLLTNAYQRIEIEKQQLALRESESKYRLLAENAGDVIFILNMELNYIYVSPAVKTLRGYTVEEALKHNIREVLTPDSLKLAQKIISEFLPEKGKSIPLSVSPQVVELEMKKKDGNTVWTEVKVSLLMDDDRMPTGFQGVTRDISIRKKAQHELLKSREEYRSFFEDDLTADYISTAEGKLLNCNPAFLTMFGFESKEEALQYDMRKIHVSSAARENLIKELLKNNKLISLNYELVRKDGTIFSATANIIAGFDEHRNLKTFKGYIIDDSERKSAIEQIRKLSRATEQSPASVVITDLNGNIEYVNPKFSEVTGYSENEAIGKNPRILKSGNTPGEIYTELWETVLADKTWFGEFENKRKDGSLYWENASISPIKNDKGKTTHFLAVKEDITEKKKFIEELIEAKDHAQESDRLKSAFLANMSHEIRTPMNGILGFAGLLEEPSLTGEVQQQYLDIIKKSGARMLSIIDDIVSISKIESGLIKVLNKEINIEKKLEYIYAFFKPEVDAKGIDFSIKNSVPLNQSNINTDEDKFFSILTNLIKNAIKYTDEGSIEFGCELNDGFLQFFVKDTGIGIPDDRKEAIFERFIQAYAVDKQARQGAGLGLSIAKAYVQMLGGRIWVESSLGKGSTFYFTLPITIDSNANSDSENLNTNESEVLDKKMKILVVDDEDTSQLLISIYIDKIAKQILKASSGLEAVKICQSHPDIDIVLMDIQLPDLNGLDATRQIRQFNKNIVIIAQTAFALSGDRKKAIAAGCDDYISKPITKSDLLTLLKLYSK